MKKLLPLAFAAGLCLALTSCVTDSVNPLCLPDMAKPDPRLLGIWYDAKEGETIVFTQEKGAWVHITNTSLDFDPGKPPVFDPDANYDAFPTVIGENTFLNVLSSTDAGKKRTYYLIRYVISQDHVLQMSMIPPDIAAKLVHEGKINGEVRDSNSSTAITLTNSSSDIWGTADDFGFVYQTLNGNGTITAEVTGLTNTNNYAKAGLVMRNDLSPGSPYAGVFVTPTSGVVYQWRTSENSTTSYQSGTTQGAPIWVQLIRNGSVVAAFTSPDDVNWSEIGQETVPLSTTVYVGLAATSHNNTQLTTASFQGATLGPLAPTGLVATASATNPDEIDLTWTNNDPDATSIAVQESTDGGITWTTLDTLTSNSVSYAATNLDPTQNYQFRIAVTDATGTSNSSSSSSTQPNPPPPSAPTDLTGSIDSNLDMILVATANPTDSNGNAIWCRSDGW